MTIEEIQTAMRLLLDQQELATSIHIQEVKDLRWLLEDRLAENARLREEIKQKDAALAGIIKEMRGDGPFLFFKSKITIKPELGAQILKAYGKEDV